MIKKQMEFDSKQYLSMLKKEFERHGDPQRARMNEQYMRNKFSFYGIKSPLRNEIQKPFLLRSYLPPKAQLHVLVKRLWEEEKRDFKYFSIDLSKKYMKDMALNDIDLYEMMIVNASWWDTVDLIASTLVGAYLKVYPDRRWELIKKWIASDNMWLQRTCLIFQLKYKDDVDTALLTYAIEKTSGTKEFFLNKAIGWSLRSFARNNPAWVLEFVENNELSNLSRREALKHFI